MQHDIRQMGRSAAGSEKLDIEHVGDPGERKGIRRVPGSEGPSYAGNRQAGADMLFGDVIGIVVIEKVVGDGLPIDGEKRYEEDEIDPDAAMRSGNRFHFADGGFTSAICEGAAHPEESSLTRFGA